MQQPFRENSPSTSPPLSAVDSEANKHSKIPTLKALTFQLGKRTINSRINNVRWRAPKGGQESQGGDGYKGCYFFLAYPHKASLTSEQSWEGGENLDEECVRP